MTSNFARTLKAVDQMRNEQRLGLLDRLALMAVPVVFTILIVLDAVRRVG
jgi:hypothetical protein